MRLTNFNLIEALVDLAVRTGTKEGDSRFASDVKTTIVLKNDTIRELQHDKNGFLIWY